MSVPIKITFLELIWWHAVRAAKDRTIGGIGLTFGLSSQVMIKLSPIINAILFIADSGLRCSPSWPGHTN
jgi:hypothetical protein